MIGVASVESMKPNSAPELSVYVESQDIGRDAEHDRAGPVERPAARPPGKRRIAFCGCTQSILRCAVAAGDGGPPTAPAGGHSPSATSSRERVGRERCTVPRKRRVLTTTGDSDSEAPAYAEPVAKEPSFYIPTVAIMLTRWVMQAAQKLARRERQASAPVVTT